VEIHYDIWRSIPDKSAALNLLSLMRISVRYLLAYPVLIWRYVRSQRHAAVIVGYMGNLDVLVLWPFARMRGTPVIWDMFLSLYDTE
jgi:hypothetical protein